MEQTWKCSGNDLRKMPLQIWEEDLSILSNAEAMKRVLLAWKQIENRKEIKSKQTNYNSLQNKRNNQKIMYLKINNQIIR